MPFGKRQPLGYCGVERRRVERMGSNGHLNANRIRSCTSQGSRIS